jgi:hypothetical protein
MAITNFNTSKFKSGTQATRAYGVPPLTFYNCIGSKQL